MPTIHRESSVIAVHLLLPSNPQAQVYPLPVMVSLERVVDDGGNIIGQPVQHQGHSSPEDFTDDLLAKMNAQLGLVGLQISRAG